LYKKKNYYSESEEEKQKPRSAESLYNFTLGNDIAGLRKKRTPVNPELMKTGVGNWEVHTKGIGAKLLLQMGFEPGKGLGKQLQGISAPVEARLRRGRGAIGAYGPEKKVLDIKTKTEDIDLKKISKGRSSQWRKLDKNEKKKSNYSYRSVDEILEDGRLRTNRKVPIINAEIAKCKVTDMTTPEQRVFSGYHALGKRHLQPGEDLSTTDKKTTINFSLPELQHNLDMIVDMCEQNIIQNDRRTKHLNNRVISLIDEKQTLLQIVEQHAQLIGTLENALAMINKLVDRNSEMTLKETAEAFKILQERHYEEYKAYDLGDLACSFVIPKIKEHLSNWNPLTHSKLPLVLFKEWKDILEFGQLNHHTRSMSPYDQLIWNAWMPSVRGAIQLVLKYFYAGLY
jgi:tuftelin-interacting protein 11